MDIHYNAFISYRHKPEDIRVATEVQRALERFHIPKAVRKNQKGQMKLFRDKDELPITSNLSDNITMALENSDYLIVICSTHTRESLWVQREIETFLKTHTYDQVLTVLVDGDPYETIPEILLYRDVVDPVTGEVTKEPLEPLSCDWRLGKKQAMREELPRLAAVLLGCSYDELRQRQRQYKMRRMMTVLGTATAASLCLMAYFLYTSIIIQQANDDLHAANEEISRANAEIIAANEEISQANEEIRQANVQIQANYEEALRNQSQYLASAASERYAAGDRMTAISLAMAALPTAENPRPYVPAAELTLTDALGIYTTERNVIADGAMDCGVLITDFAVTADGKLLYTLDSSSRITVWDTYTYAKLATVEYAEKDYEEMHTVGENLVIRRFSTDPALPSVSCYTPKGELLWTVESAADMAMLGDETVLLMDTVTSAVDLSTATKVSFLDPADGTRQREDLTIPEDGNGFWAEQYTPGGLLTLDFGSWNKDILYLVDLTDDSVTVIDPVASLSPELREFDYVMTVSVTEQRDVLLMVVDDSGEMNGPFMTMYTTSPANAQILCFRGENWNLAWQQQIQTYRYSDLRTIAPIPESGKILCQKENTFYVLDGATGEILSRGEAEANVLSIYVEANQAYGVLENGSYFQYRYNTNECLAMQLMEADLLKGTVADGYFTMTANSTHITVYRTEGENAWATFAQSPTGYLSWAQFVGDRVVTVTSGNNLEAFDLQTGELLWANTVPSGYSTEYLCLSTDGTTLYAKDYNNVMAVDLATGEMRTMAIQKTVNDAYAGVAGFGLGGWDRYLYMLRQDNDLYYAEMDLTTGEIVLYPYAKDVEGNSWDVGSKTGFAAISENYAWLWDKGTLYELDLGTHALRPILEGLTEYPACQYHERQNLLTVCAGNEILFFRPGGEQTNSISLGIAKGVHVSFLGEELLVLSNEAQLLRFDMDGNRLSQTELHIYTSFYNYATPTEGRQMNISCVDTGNGDLILNVFGLGNIIDCSQWSVRAYALNYKGYDPLADRLICYTNYELGTFPRYTTAQVIQLAEEELNGYTLSEEMKEFYGIG